MEAGGKDGLDSDEHCATLTCGVPGVLHGTRTFLLQTKDGQVDRGASAAAAENLGTRVPSQVEARDQRRFAFWQEKTEKTDLGKPCPSSHV